MLKGGYYQYDADSMLLSPKHLVPPVVYTSGMQPSSSTRKERDLSSTGSDENLLENGALVKLKMAARH